MSADQIRLGRAVEAAIGVVAVRSLLARGADGIDERAVAVELQDLGVVAAEVRRPGVLAGIGPAGDFAVARDVDEVVVIDGDAVLATRPEAAVLGRHFFSRKPGSPGPPHAWIRVPRLVELEDGRRGAQQLERLSSVRGCPSPLIGLPFRVLAGNRPLPRHRSG